jgi:hypothetical protein
MSAILAQKKTFIRKTAFRHLSVNDIFRAAHRAACAFVESGAARRATLFKHLAAMGTVYALLQGNPVERALSDGIRRIRWTLAIGAVAYGERNFRRLSGIGFFILEFLQIDAEPCRYFGNVLFRELRGISALEHGDRFLMATDFVGKNTLRQTKGAACVLEGLAYGL